MKSSIPDFSFEYPQWKRGYTVIGVDEVGRGALAGPVYVGAVSFPYDPPLLDYVSKSGINDSKKLTASQRERLSQFIKQHAMGWSVAAVSAHHINTYSITSAVRKGVRMNIQKLITPEASKTFVLLDAFSVKHIRGVGLRNQQAIIHGDALSISIAAASIIAKVERDRYMTSLSATYASYGWDKNKGYGTQTHIHALTQHGPTPLHRKLYIKRWCNVNP